MGSLAQILNARLEAILPMALLAIIAGLGVMALFVALLAVPRGKPKPTNLMARRVKFEDIQARLYKAQIDISAREYVIRSLKMGIPLGLGLFILIGSIVLFAVGILAGFMATWTKLEQERDRKQVRYTKQLASACDTIRTAYGVNPSLKKALEAVAEYGQSPVREDFQEVLVAASQERFVEGLEEIADRRRSIVFDTVATALLRASEASGEVNDMLVRLADSTRQNVAAFEDAMTSQLNARSSVTWGTYGPWMIFCVFRLITLLIAFAGGGGLVAPLVGFFSTPGGNIVALIAALVSIFVYRHCINVSQRGLVVRRVSVAEATLVVPRMGQKPIASQKSESAFNAQSRPVTAN
jgi:Flp pilus assembly protein TadB